LSVIFECAGNWESLQTHPNTQRLAALGKLLRELHQKLDNVDWIGVYRKVDHDGLAQLVKESYLGAPSRPFFPLTEEFAQGSNNSWVGLNGKAKLVQDITQYQGPYYECNSLVLSELCAPIFFKDQVIGIIDVESHSKDFFTPERVLAVANFCVQLGNCNFGIK
jgi:L-methionine (R)-S-oxide reductase